MNILAFDTCFDACSVAIQSGDRGAVASDRVLMRRGHAEALLPMIRRAMTTAGLDYGALDRIAVTHGPGTFTGSRIGMSAAIGLAFAHDLSVVTYSSLQCVARAALEALGDHVARYDGVLVARDAKRGHVFVEQAGRTGDQVSAPSLLSIAAAQRLARTRQWFVVGSGASLVLADDRAGATDHWPDAPTPGIGEPDARFMLADASSRQPVTSPQPLYLRPPDATPSSQPPLARLTAPRPSDA